MSLKSRFEMVVDEYRKKMLPSRICDDCAESKGYKISKNAYMSYSLCGLCQKVRWTSHKDDMEKKA